MLPYKRIFSRLAGSYRNPKIHPTKSAQPVEGGTNCPPYYLFSLLFLQRLLLRCHTSFTLTRNCIYTHPRPRPHHHLTFLQLVIAHHDACNVTLVSRRRAASLSLPPRGEGQRRALCRLSERENEKARDCERGVSGYNQIRPLHHHHLRAVGV